MVTGAASFAVGLAAVIPLSPIISPIPFGPLGSVIGIVLFIVGLVMAVVGSKAANYKVLSEIVAEEVRSLAEELDEDDED